MTTLLSPLRLPLGLCGAITVLALGPSCKGDDARAKNRDVSTLSTRASRVSQSIVGDSLVPEGDRQAVGSDNYTLKLPGADAGVIQVEPIKDRIPLEADEISGRELSGIVLDAEWKQSDLPAPSGVAESATEALDELRAKTRLRMRIELLAAGRMRITFLGLGYPWLESTELRSRVDKFGHVLTWPAATAHRNVVVGALRALFTDRRLDVGPLFAPKVTALPAGAWLGQAATRRVLTTPVAEIQLDQATIPNAGLGAILLCRFLVELAGIEPSSRFCSSDLVPLHAQITNAPGGKLGFAVSAVSKKVDLSLSGLQVPPEHSNFEFHGLPLFSGGTGVRAYLSALRLRAVAAPSPNGAAALLTPSSGLLAINSALSLRALMVDGVTVAWLMPGSELALPELRQGVYSIAWRDFFGSSIDPPRNVTLPNRVTLESAQEPAN